MSVSVCLCAFREGKEREGGWGGVGVGGEEATGTLYVIERGSGARIRSLLQSQ
jgi:hypothetical protein